MSKLYDVKLHTPFTALTIPDKQAEKTSNNSNYDVSVLIGGVMAGIVVVFIGIMLFVFLRRLVKCIVQSSFTVTIKLRH